MRPSRFLLPLLGCLAPALHADIPNEIPHQGRIAVDGENFDGVGQFKFLLFGDADADPNSGNESAVWSNAATSPPNLDEPASAVAIPVTKGLYAVGLGDSALAGMASLPASLNPAGQQLYLRQWFNDGTLGFQQLAPDLPIGAVAYALHSAAAERAAVAASAQSVEAGAVGSAQIADGSILATDIASGAVTSSEILDATLRLADFDLSDIDTRYAPQNARTIVVDPAGGGTFTTMAMY